MRGDDLCRLRPDFYCLSGHGRAQHARGPEWRARSGLARARRGGSDAGVESNARLTGATAAVLLVLLAAEGVTVLESAPC